MIALHRSTMGARLPVAVRQGLSRVQNDRADSARWKCVDPVLLATLSQLLHEPQERCRQILDANMSYLSVVERFRNQPQSRARLQQHLSRFQFPQSRDLKLLDASDHRSRLVVSYHTGDFIYGSNVFANHESAETAQYVLMQKPPSAAFQQNLTNAFGETRFKSRTQLLLESFNFLKLRKRLNAGKSSLLTFADLPPDFGRRIQIEFLGREAWFPVGPALMALTGRMPILPLLIYSVGHSQCIRLWPLIEPNRKPGQSAKRVARDITQQLSFPLQWLIQHYPEQWRFLSVLPSFFEAPEFE